MPAFPADMPFDASGLDQNFGQNGMQPGAGGRSMPESGLLDLSMGMNFGELINFNI